MSRLPSVLALIGPTAVGKTDLAISMARRLARRLPIEIISMDSVLVYRGLDVGTGKPDRESMAGVPHHLIDIRDPHEPYSAADFARHARALIPVIRERGACPLLAGGTGLYYRALVRGLSPLPGADVELREAMAAEAARSGWAALHRRLARVDPRAAARIRVSDPQRIQRALEVYELTGTPLSELHASNSPQPCPWPVRAAALIPGDRSWLHRRIELRFTRMLEQGLEREVRALRDFRALPRTLPAMRAVGYRQMLQYLDGELDRPQMVQKAVVATRQLARRQLTWLRKEAVDRILDPCPGDPLDEACRWVESQIGRRGYDERAFGPSS